MGRFTPDLSTRRIPDPYFNPHSNNTSTDDHSETAHAPHHDQSIVGNGTNSSPTDAASTTSSSSNSSSWTSAGERNRGVFGARETQRITGSGRSSCERGGGCGRCVETTVDGATQPRCYNSARRFRRIRISGGHHHDRRHPGAKVSIVRLEWDVFERRVLCCSGGGANRTTDGKKRGARQRLAAGGGAMPSRWYTLLALPFPDQQVGRREFAPSYHQHRRPRPAGYFSNPL